LIDRGWTDARSRAVSTPGSRPVIRSSRSRRPYGDEATRGGLSGMEERREVVERRPDGAVTTDVVTREPAASVAVDQQRVVQYDPYAERRGTAAKLVQLVWLVFGIVEALIAIRFALRLLGANPSAGLAH